MRRGKPELGLEAGAARTVLSSAKRVNTNPPRPVQGTAPRTCYNQDAGCYPQSASSPEPLPSSTRTQPCCFIPTRSATISQTPSVVLARSPVSVYLSHRLLLHHLLSTSTTLFLFLFTPPVEILSTHPPPPRQSSSPLTHQSADRPNSNHPSVPSEKNPLLNFHSTKAILPFRLQCRRKKA